MSAENNGILTREQILGADDIAMERVDVPEWGGAIYVRVMSGTERDHYQSRRLTIVGNSQRFNLENATVELVALTACDAKGKRLFSEADVAELGKKSSAALQRIAAVAQRLNGLAPDSVEDAEKN